MTMFDYHAVTSGKHPRGADVSKRDAHARSLIEDLEFQTEKLFMITEALWQILKEKHGYQDDELIRRVGLIDLKDGKLDGKVAKSAPLSCHACHRKMARHHVKCIYCGKPAIRDVFAR